MIKTTYQKPEIRDANDNIIQQGAFGKNTALANATNDGWIDYVANDLEALHDAQTAADTSISTETLTVSGKTTTGTLEASSATVSGSITTTGLTVTGETTVPTAHAGNSSKAIANTEFVANAVSNLVNSAPETLDTLGELSKALGDDPNFATTVATELGKKVDKTDAEAMYVNVIGDTMTGDLTAPTINATTKMTAPTINATTKMTAPTINATTKMTAPTVDSGDNSQNVATTAFVNAKAGNYLPLSGGTVTGGLTVKGTITGNLAGNATNDGNGKNIASTYLPAVVGVVQAFAGSTIPTGWLLCDGSAVSRTDYAALYAVIGTTYGAGDGSTTFNLPNLVDKFIEGAATAGTVKAAGLPNITGSGQAVAWQDISYSGAFVSERRGSTANAGSQAGNNYFLFDFDASRSSSIYGNSTTVQPPALTMRYIIKY